MGAVKEAMEDKVHWAARQTGQDEEGVLREWFGQLRENLGEPESILEFVERKRKERRYTYCK